MPDNSSPTFGRYHSLDALRATMMLLGLVLHTAINYLPAIPEDAGWPYQDAATSLVLAWLIAFIHMFRMPTFFVVAGFFAAFVYQRRGPRAFLRHRLARLGVPLLCAWPLLYAVLVGSAPYAQAFTAAPPPHPEIAPGVDLLHLWFLYQLLAFCAAAVLLVPALHHAPGHWRARFLDAFGRQIHRPSGVVGLAAVSSLLLLPMETWHFDTASSLLPAPHVLGGYAVFFAFGWLVFTRPVIEGFRARAWTHFGAGFVFHGAYLFLFDQGYPDPTAPGKELLRHPMYAAFHDAGLTDAAATGDARARDRLPRAGCLAAGPRLPGTVPALPGTAERRLALRGRRIVLDVHRASAAGRLAARPAGAAAAPRGAEVRARPRRT